MDQQRLERFRVWLNSQGYDIDPKDQLWMEDCIGYEHKWRDIAELAYGFHVHLLERAAALLKKI